MLLHMKTVTVIIMQQCKCIKEYRVLVSINWVDFHVKASATQITM